MNSHEKVIQFLLNLERQNNDTIVIVSRNNITSLDLAEKEIMTILNELEKDGYIRFVQKSTHNDLSIFAKVDLLRPCREYFERKEAIKAERVHAKRVERNQWIQFWIPVGISLIALLKSFSAELVQLLKLITQWLR